jgi:hypothetical protein
VVLTVAGLEVAYDKLVLATGSFAWMPPVPGLTVAKGGVFVYRTIADLQVQSLPPPAAPSDPVRLAAIGVAARGRWWLWSCVFDLRCC